MATINGNSGNNNLVGTSAKDTLNGYGGSDTLNGGAGIDTLNGGTGNDTYIVDSTTDTISEYSGGGSHDLVKSSVSFTLSGHLNDLTLTGTKAINGTGNSFNNIITGNVANNVLSGGLGNDTLNGGLGNDTYIVDSATDVITGEGANGGLDTVLSSVSYTLSAYVNNLVLTGTSAIDGVGNNLDNSISGNSANNILYGGDGNDTLNGGNDPFNSGESDHLLGAAGNDYLTGGGYMDSGNGNDTIMGDYADMYGGNGNDFLSSDFSSELYGGNGNDTLDGDDLSLLYGEDGNDVLYVSYSRAYGGDGDDVLNGNQAWMSGGNGNDTLTGGGSNSYVFEYQNESVDTITDFSSDYEDQILVYANGFSSELTAGAAITPEQFRIGTVATDTSNRFIYNNANGALFFDPTGSNNGATDQLQLATLVGAPEITNNDIVVF